MGPMSHKEAVENLTAARYLSGDLSEHERTRFENHYFECAECAKEVGVDVIFAANIKAVFKDQEPSRRHWWEIFLFWRR